MCLSFFKLVSVFPFTFSLISWSRLTPQLLGKRSRPNQKVLCLLFSSFATEFVQNFFFVPWDKLPALQSMAKSIDVSSSVSTCALSRSVDWSVLTGWAQDIIPPKSTFDHLSKRRSAPLITHNWIEFFWTRHPLGNSGPWMDRPSSQPTKQQLISLTSRWQRPTRTHTHPVGWLSLRRQSREQIYERIGIVNTNV